MAKHDEKALGKRLGQVPLFASTTGKQRVTLAKLGKVMSWNEGVDGVKEGSKGAAFFLLLDGTVDVSQNGKAVARLRDGDFFGETALLTGAPRNATVTAATDTTLFVLARPAFHAAVKADPTLALKLMEAMALRQPAIG